MSPPLFQIQKSDRLKRHVSSSAHSSVRKRDAQVNNDSAQYAGCSPEAPQKRRVKSSSKRGWEERLESNSRVSWCLGTFGLRTLVSNENQGESGRLRDLNQISMLFQTDVYDQPLKKSSDLATYVSLSTSVTCIFLPQQSVAWHCALSAMQMMDCRV